jgi:HlyD family secretion protein
MRKIVTFLIIVAILAAGGYGFYLWQQRQQAAQTSKLETTPAARGSLTATIGATGQVRSKQTASLVWKTSGTVQDVYVNVGDTVKTGDKLAELAQTSLPQTVILARADLETANQALSDLYTNAEISKVQATQSIATYAKDVKSAQYQLDNFTIPDNQAGLDTLVALDLMKQKLDEATKAFEPYKFLASGNKTRDEFKEKLDLAQSDYNAAVKRLDYENALEVAQANLNKARKDYEKWKNGPSADEIAATKARIAAAQATLSQAWIEAPFDSTISLAIPQPGDLVDPNTISFRVDDMSSLLVDLAVSEVDINQIEVSQPVSLTFDAVRGGMYQGEVVYVDRVGTSNQGVVDFVVTVQLTNADERVKPGMTAAVNVVVSQLADVLLVPNRAVRFKDGKQVVYILQNNQTVPINIQLGATAETTSQVLDGDLKVGDLIILNPPTQFQQSGGPPGAGGGG